MILRDAQGHTLTRKDLQNPTIFKQATANLPGYLPDYNYQSFAHVRIARFAARRLRTASGAD